MTVERRALSGSLVTGLNVLVQFGQAIVLVPLFLTYWGTDKYGLWLALLAATELIITLDAGHQTFVGNEIARLYPVDQPQMRRVLASAFWVALLIGAVELALGALLWVGGALPALLGNPAESIAAHNLGPALLVFLAMWATCGSVGGLLVRILPPAGRYTRSALWGVGSRLMLLAIWAGGVLAGLTILELIVLQVCGQVLHSVLLFYDLRRTCAEVYPFWSPADLGLGFRNLAKSIVLTGTSILTQLQQNGLNLLVSALFGAALLPVLTTARTLANVFIQGTAIVAAPLSPDVIRYHVKREHDKLIGAWSGIWFVSGALMNVGLVVSLLLVQPFYAAWTRGEMLLDWRMYLPLIAAVSIKAFAVPLFTYLSGLNHLRGIVAVAAVQAIAVLGGTWAFAPQLGLAGAALAILVSEVAGAIVLVAFVRVLVKEIDMEFPWRPFNVAAIAPLVSCAAFAAAHFVSIAHSWIVATALVLLSGAITLQWRNLPDAVKARMVGLLPR